MARPIATGAEKEWTPAGRGGSYINIYKEALAADRLGRRS